MNKGLRLITKLAYGVGDMGSALTGAMISVLFAIFLTDAVGLRPAYAALIVFVGRTWEYVTDPIIGYLSNKTRTRWGSYRPYLLFGAMPFGISFALLWWIPPIHTEAGLLIYYIAAYFLNVVMMNLLCIPYVSLTPRITSDYDERTSLTSYRMVFSLTGSMIAFVVPLAIIGDVVPQNTTIVLTVGIVMAAISSLPYILTFLGTHEEVSSEKLSTENAASEKPAADQHSDFSIRESIRATAKNKPFLFAVMIYLFTTTALEVTSSMTFYFFKYSLGVKESTDIFLGLMFIAAVVSVPLWNLASRKLDKTRAYIIGAAATILLRIIISVLQPGTSIWMLYSLMVLGGVALSAGQTLPWAIIPDSIEYDEYITGNRHEGVFYSFMQLARGIAVSIAIPGVLLLLDLAGYKGSASVQTGGANLTIRLLFGGVPVLLFAGGILAAKFYPLGRTRFEEIKKELESRKSTGV